MPGDSQKSRRAAAPRARRARRDHDSPADGASDATEELFPDWLADRDASDSDSDSAERGADDSTGEAPANTEFALHFGDCVDGMAKLPEQTVDIVVTSPPYNLGIDYATYDDRLSLSDYLAWTRDWATAVKRVLKPEGSFFLNIGASHSSPLLPHQVILELAELFEVQNTLHWIKSITVETTDGEEVSAGHFKPINSQRFVNDCHEYVFHLTHSGKVPLDRRGAGVAYADKSNIARWKHTGGHDKRCRGNNWFVPYETIKSRDKDRPHPATFPVKLAEYCLRLHGTDPAATLMLDPFLGIGHSAEAATRFGVGRFIGFEIDEGYLATACERLGTEMLRD